MPGIDIGADERVVLVGTTGSGKTTLARRLLLGRPYLVIVDPKHDFSWGLAPDYDDIYESLTELRKWRGPAPAIYRPGMGELAGYLSEFWAWAWEIKPITVYIDELTSITKEVSPPMGLRRALVQGRSKGLSVWMATQRPARVPVVVLSEAGHFFVGLLRIPADRKRMAEITDQPDIQTVRVGEHEFWYVNSHRPRDPLIRVNARRLSVALRSRRRVVQQRAG